MQPNFNSLNSIKYIVGNASTIQKMSETRPLKPFSDIVLSFINDLSKAIMISGKAYSDVVTLGFWCRRSSLIQEKNKYDDISYRVGRGTIFHIAPSNVPVNFAFTFIAGLLAGNANIVRVPSKYFEQVDIITKEINDLLEVGYGELKPYISMIQYAHNQAVTDTLSIICDTRIIWGGDQTIFDIRKSPLNTRATEIDFADRYSLAVINSNEFLENDNKDKIIQDFYNDTYFSDQNACTAPSLVVWVGNEKKSAKKVFWNMVHSIVTDKYSFTPVQAVGKLHAMYKVATVYDLKCENHEDEYITRMKLNKIDHDLMKYKHNSGFFFEYDADNLSDIMPVITDRCQTLTYFGVSRTDLKQFINVYMPRGVDRVVPMGKSMDFDLVWDGYDLIRYLSRVVTLI